MENNNDNKLEHILSKSIKEMEMSSPSIDFTTNIMDQINAAEKSIELNYKPLISKPVWLIIAAAVISLVVYIMISQQGTVSWFDQFDLSALTNNGFTEALSNWKISTTMSYGLILFGIMFLIQIPLLKRHFDSQLKW